MNAFRVFVTNAAVTPEALRLLREEGFDVEVFDGVYPPPRSLLLEKVRRCHALLTDIDDIIDVEALSIGSHLRVVANNAVGYDNFDIAAANLRGIAMSNTPGVLQESTADFTIGLLLAVARHIVKGDRHVRSGEWKGFDPLSFLGADIYGRTLGIVGLGQIGSAVARRAIGFSMRVIYHSRRRDRRAEEQYGFEYSELSPMLSAADFVTLHLPSTPETQHFIGTKEFQEMKSTAILINTARGKVVDQQALYRALRDNVIAGAGLDVTDPEPILQDDPLLTLPNVVVTPHIASSSTDAIIGQGMLAAGNIIACLTGRPMPSCVNPEGLKGHPASK